MTSIIRISHTQQQNIYNAHHLIPLLYNSSSMLYSGGVAKLRPQQQVSLGQFSTSPYIQLLRTTKSEVKSYASRKRRSNYMDTDTYVYIEAGKSQEFVSEEELKAKLKGWLQNWPNKSLPPDLARFDTVDDAVTFLVKSVCELEIDGDVGSIQWYQVRVD